MPRVSRAFARLPCPKPSVSEELCDGRYPQNHEWGHNPCSESLQAASPHKCLCDFDICALTTGIYEGGPWLDRIKSHPQVCPSHLALMTETARALVRALMLV